LSPPAKDFPGDWPTGVPSHCYLFDFRWINNDKASNFWIAWLQSIVTGELCLVNRMLWSRLLFIRAKPAQNSVRRQSGGEDRNDGGE